jgi:hypothetical protein
MPTAASELYTRIRPAGVDRNSLAGIIGTKTIDFVAFEGPRI